MATQSLSIAPWLQQGTAQRHDVGCADASVRSPTVARDAEAVAGTEVVPFSALARGSGASEGVGQSDRGLVDRYLVLTLAGGASTPTSSAGETVLLPLDAIQEVLPVPRRGILPVPAVPLPILGLCQYRGNLLWLVDLGHFLGYGSGSGSSGSTPLQTPQTMTLTAIAIQVNGLYLGLVVSGVRAIEEYPAHDIQAVQGGLFPPRLTPFLAGYVVNSAQPILNAAALIETLQRITPQGV